MRWKRTLGRAGDHRDTGRLNQGRAGRTGDHQGMPEEIETTTVEQEAKVKPARQKITTTETV